jgi:hypothetical protein
MEKESRPSLFIFNFEGMIKRAASVLIFIVSFVAIFVYLNKIFVSTHRYVNTFEDFIALSKKTNVDIIFYGSSMAHTAYNPLVINHFANSISHNLGSDALRLPISSLVFQESLKHTTPKLVVLEIHDGSIRYPPNKEIRGLQLPALDFISNYSFNKVRTINEIYGNDKTLSTMYPLFRNRTTWNKISPFKLSKRQKVDTARYFYFGGHYGLIKPIDSLNRVQYKGFRTNPIKEIRKKVTITGREKESLTSFIQLARKKNIEVLIITSPYIQARYNDYSFFSELKGLCDSLKVNYINLNNRYNEIGLNLNDFSDKLHLSKQGSIKTSQFLANFINNNYAIENRSHEDIWIATDSIYQKVNDQFAKREGQIFERKLASSLTKEIEVKNIRIVKNRNRMIFSIIIDNNDRLENDLKKYKLAVYIYPKEEDIKQVDGRRRELSKYFDQADVLLKNYNDTINFKLSTKIEKIEKIKLFIYNSEKYSGIIGESVFYDEINFK